eukprot:s744_g24.t1
MCFAMCLVDFVQYLSHPRLEAGEIPAMRRRHRKLPMSPSCAVREVPCVTWRSGAGRSIRFGRRQRGGGTLHWVGGCRKCLFMVLCWCWVLMFPPPHQCCPIPACVNSVSGDATREAVKRTVTSRIGRGVRIPNDQHAARAQR